MPISPTKSLLNIATDSKIRVHERIIKIKGEDKRISSPEEAKAILAITNNEISWLEDKNELPLAHLEASNYLKYGDTNLRDLLVKAAKYIKRKSSIAFDRITQYFGDDYSIAQNVK